MMKNITLLSICIGVTFLGCAEKRQKVTLVEEARVEAPQIIEEEIIIQKPEPTKILEKKDLISQEIETESEVERKKREFDDMIKNTPLILKNNSEDSAYE